ncbi:uncharacterized protein [Pyxicephalus adspersus]|uniref:uncharacterized protein n=1 Tax=Pyxicephalus adspersus TaxID=30357 RepID=UPI003B5BAC38
MAPPVDHSLHYTDGTFTWALLLINLVLLSAAALLHCLSCKRKQTFSTGNSETQSSEPNKEVVLQESEIPENHGKSNGAIPGGTINTKSESKKNRKKVQAPDKNGLVVKDASLDNSASLDLKRRGLPLPPINSVPSEYEDPLYDFVKDEQNSVHHAKPGSNEKHLGKTSGSNSTTAENSGGVHNPDILENLNPLYTSVDELHQKIAEIKESGMKYTPETQEPGADLPSPGPYQGSEKGGLNNLNPPINEPIYSVVRKDKLSIKRSPEKTIIQKENIVAVEMDNIQAKCNSKASANPPTEMNLQVPGTSSYKLNMMLQRCKKRSYKSSTPQTTIIIDLEEPPPLPDRIFDIEK